MRSFADWLVEVPENRFLEEMARVLPWPNIEATLERELPNPGGGRPPYPFRLLFRMTLIQWWYGLGDLETEFQCTDRLSFRKFLGLGLSESVPDGTTLANFRHKLEALGLQAKLLQQLEAALQAKGLLAKKGTLVDATFVRAARPKADPDQQVGRKGRGYTTSISADKRTKFIRQVTTTPASVHDSQALAEVLPSEPGLVYADLGYWGEPCKQTIRAVNGVPCIPYKKPKGKHLKPWQLGVNARLSHVRVRVEHVFARWKTQFNLKNSRYQGLDKVNAYMHGLALAYNFQRLGFLSRRRSLGISWA